MGELDGVGVWMSLGEIVRSLQYGGVETERMSFLFFYGGICGHDVCLQTRLPMLLLNTRPRLFL